MEDKNEELAAEPDKKPKKEISNDILLNRQREKERKQVINKAIQSLLEDIKTINQDFEPYEPAKDKKRP